MVYRGRVRNGKFELDEAVALPECAEVEVAITATDGPAKGELGGTLNESLRDFIGAVDDLPDDFSVNHDHYLYGVPKRH
jgi:hypothetical protein